MDGEDDARGAVDDAARDAVDGAVRPELRTKVLDTTDVQRLAEFYRQLLGWDYRPGDEPPPPGEPDPAGADWLVLERPGGGPGLAFQHTDDLARATWPGGGVPQQLHLDTSVPTRAALDAVHERVLAMGAVELRDRADDPQEPLHVYADPAGHPFCVFVAPDHPVR